MIKEEFRKVAEHYNGKYAFKDKNVLGKGMSTLPVTYHQLLVNHKDTTITLKYEYGNHYLATVKMEIKNANLDYIFNLKKTSPYIQLFFRNRKTLVVESKFENAKRQIESLIESSELEDMAKKTQFDPKIVFNTSGARLLVNTMYYLGFKETERSIAVMIGFYKGLYNLIAYS